MSACAWYCSIMSRPPPPGTAFGLVIEYSCSANQVKPFPCNPGNTWQWPLTNVKRKPLINSTSCENGPGKGNGASPAHRALCVAWGVTGLCHLKKTKPASGCLGLCSGHYPNLLPLWLSWLLLTKTSVGARDLWDGGQSSHLLPHQPNLHTHQNISSGWRRSLHKTLAPESHYCLQCYFFP